MVRLPGNHLHLAEGDRVLRSEDRFTELVDLYQSKGLLRKGRLPKLKYGLYAVPDTMATAVLLCLQLWLLSRSSETVRAPWWLAYGPLMHRKYLLVRLTGPPISFNACLFSPLPLPPSPPPPPGEGNIYPFLAWPPPQGEDTPNT